MSRIVRLLFLLCIAFLAPAKMASAQVTAEQAIETAKETYGPHVPNSQTKCPKPTSSDEIIVCRELEEQSQFRVKSTSQLDPKSHEALNNGIPDAPNVTSPGLDQYGQVTMRGCGLQKCPPPPAYMIDFSTLPEPPEGSDADLISKGEKPAN